jgi:hypothetical protein
MSTSLRGWWAWAGGGTFLGRGWLGLWMGGTTSNAHSPPIARGEPPARGGARGALRGGSGGYLGGRW